MPSSQLQNADFPSRKILEGFAENPTVTVIIPAFNAAKFIAKTIESVKQQTFLAWDLIVVDDCSTDATRDVVDGLAASDPRIKLISLERNHGAPAGPRNRGASVARGRWIAFLDADDLWHPQKLELQLKAAARHSAKFCSTAMEDFSDEAELHYPALEEPGKVRWLSFASHRIKGRIPSSSVLMEADIARTFPFEEHPSYKAVEDYHCWMRILHSGVKCLRLETPLLKYRISPDQISRSKFKMTKRMYNVHRKFETTTPAAAAFFTLTHVAGAIYLRHFRGKL